MKRLLLIALCSSCTFSHAVTHRPVSAPSVGLTPAMRKLDRQQRSAPWWTFVGDTALVLGGFEAGIVVHNETVNLAGLAICGLTFASLAYTAFALDEP